VFVEKPLALTVDEVMEIENAISAVNPAPFLMMGFNRRFSPAVLQIREFIAPVHAPLSVMIRFSSGFIPPEHWIHDETVGGGRLIGEACHAIDLATFLTGSPPVRVYAESVGGRSASEITDDQCFITLRHANGSISSIGYLSGGDRAFPKERVEIFGGGRVAVIDDFREVTTCVDGKLRRKKYLSQDKGYKAEMEVLAKTLISGTPSPISWEEIRSVSLASILAVRSIREGIAFEVR
jgi:predicted dehydrogenase